MDAIASPPTQDALVVRWALLLAPCLLAPLIIWGVLDVPADYNSCSGETPPRQDAAVSEFRGLAFPIVGVLAIWLTFLLARWSIERERRVGGPSARAAVASIVLAWAGLGTWALEVADVIGVDNLTWGLLSVVSLAVGALCVAVAVVLSAAVPAYLSRGVSASRTPRGEQLLLVFAGSLLIATPVLAVAAGLAGSGFVVGC